MYTLKKKAINKETQITRFSISSRQQEFIRRNISTTEKEILKKATNLLEQSIRSKYMKIYIITSIIIFCVFLKMKYCRFLT